MRAAVIAAAVIFVFLGVMYVRFAGDAVPPPPQPTPSPVFGPARIVALSIEDQRLLQACESFSRYPKPEECGSGNPHDNLSPVRVNLMGTTCLNVYRFPDPKAEIIDCLAKGVLLSASDRYFTDGDGLRWRSVTTPSGIQGWASTYYLWR
jgi:hypothetical protein